MYVFIHIFAVANSLIIKSKKMKMRKKFKILLIAIPAIALLMFSCSKEGESKFNDVPSITLTEAEYLSITNENTSELTEAEIIEVITDYLDVENELSTRSLTDNPSIIRKYYVSSANNDDVMTRSASCEASISVPVYEVAINDASGLAYVSGDSRYAEVLAYIPNKAKDDNAEALERRELMLSLCEGAALSAVTDIEDAKTSLREQTLAKISNELSIPVEDITIDVINKHIEVNGAIESRATPVQNPTGSIMARIYPKAKVEWSQQHPYNISLPIAPGMEGWTGANIPAGCGNVAIATALSVIEPVMYANGKYIDWGYLKQRAKIIGPHSYYYDNPIYDGIEDPQDKLELIGDLMKYIYEGTESFTTFKPGAMFDFGTTGTYTSKVVPFMRRFVNCDDMLYGLNTEAIYNSISAGRISLIGGNSGNGGAHLWVIDGCTIHSKPRSFAMPQSTRADLVRIYNVYFHCNMGWDGWDDGYYLINSDMSMTFDTDMHLYDRNFHYASNIRPR